MTADLHQTDSLDMFGATFGLPEQIEHAASVAARVDGLPPGEGVTAAVVRGMGGAFSQTSVSPWRWTSGRALPGFDSMWRIREACA